jgi:hypothetical protein
VSDKDDDEEARKIVEAGPLFGKSDDDKPHRTPIFEDRAHTPILFPEHMRSSAPQETISSRKEAVDWLNKSYACISISGKEKVLYEKSNGEIEIKEYSDFTKSLAHMRIDVTSSDGTKTKQTAITELWLIWAGRRIYENGFTFDPSRVGHYDGMYNLFKGYRGIIPREGDVAPFLDYTKDIICSGHHNNSVYLVALVSQMYQEPHLKPGVAVALRGDEGVGKSFFVEKLGYLMREYYLKTSNPAYIFGDHNGTYEGQIIVASGGGSLGRL